MSRYTPTVDTALDRVREMVRGNFDLKWMDANPAGWGHTATPGPAGLRLRDVETGHYANVPEHGSSHGSMAPRGCAVPAGTRSLGMYTLNEKSEVWAENAGLLYDEAVVRQWNSVTDVPWHKLEKLPDDIERAVCQLCTNLVEVEFVAGDMPAKWLCRINHDFHEVKLFLASQIMDEARHLDVFRKRALANGGGLMMASPGQEELLAAILEAPDYTTASALMHIFGEGFVLTLFRQGEFLAPTEVEKTIFRLCMQDEARHVAYGVKHLQYFLERHPDRAEHVHKILDVGEQAIFALTLEPQTSEPRAILAGGGLANIQLGMARLAFIYAKQVREYLRRLQIAGLDREPRLTIPKDKILDRRPGRVAAEEDIIMTDAIFPSTKWFRALARRMEEDEAAYRALGSVDCTMVVRIDAPAGPELYEVVFERYAVRSVRRLARPEDAAAGHFVLEASLKTWREMIDNIRANAGPDLTHTLNYLTFPDVPMRVTGPDQLEVDTFYRYNESLQRFFNGAAAVPTAYAA